MSLGQTLHNYFNTSKLLKLTCIKFTCIFLSYQSVLANVLASFIHVVNKT